jgi:hypothetical protein
MGADYCVKGDLKRKEMLATFVPEVEVEFAQRTPEQNRLVNDWYRTLDWYVVLRRIGYGPQFDGGGAIAKRQRVQGDASQGAA